MISVDKPLEVVEILDLYDTPLVMVLIDAVGTHYLAYCYASDEIKDSFIATPISVSRYKAVRDGAIDIRSVLVSPQSPEFYLLEVAGSEESIGAVLLNAPLPLAEDFLPVENYFIDIKDLEARIGSTSYRVDGVHAPEQTVKTGSIERIFDSLMQREAWIVGSCDDERDIFLPTCGKIQSKYVTQKERMGVSKDYDLAADQDALREPELCLAA